MATKIQNYINHIVFVIDRSGSMSGLSGEVVKVFDGQIAHLAKRSQEMNQETRVSVYLFNSSTECLVYDMDVMRLPSLRDHYQAGGNTALIDATMLATQELKMTPEIHADHAFLVYVLTDGQENDSRKYRANDLKKSCDALTANWTFACLVPNEFDRQQAVNFGFPLENTQIWSTTAKGIVEVGATMQKATDNFMTARSKGVRSTKNLFQMDVNALNTKVVAKSLTELPPTDYELLPVHKDAVIQPFVESWTKAPYRKGSAYYMLTKPEKIQNHKQICVQDKATAKVYSGTNARQILGLPDFEVKVSPAAHDKFNIFVQSTSINRKLVGGTQLIVMKK